MRILLKIKEDLYSKPDKNGNSKLIKKGIQTCIKIDTSEIKSVSEAYNTKGKIHTKKCMVDIRDSGRYIVEHKFEDIEALMQPIVIKGFIYKNKQ